MMKIRQQQFDQLAKELVKDDGGSLVAEVKELPQPAKLGAKGSLIIRKEQDERLSQVKLSVFEDRMILHIKKHFPTHYEALGEGNCRELIRYGIERAATHGFVSERDICKFIDLILCFGIEFDSDPGHAWAADILTDNSWQNASDKMDALFDAGIEHLKK